MIIRFAFEGIVTVGIKTAGRGVCAQCQVKRNKQGPPALILSHMNALMCAAEVQAFYIAPPNDMPKRNCRPRTQPRQASPQKSRDYPAMCFDDATYNSRAASLQKYNRN